MGWDHLFDDLEGQLAAEWEAERAALDAESERLRVSRLPLHDRFRALVSGSSAIALDLLSGERWRVCARVLGADWIGVDSPEDHRLRIVPEAAVQGVATDHGTLLASLSADSPGASLRERMTLGFVLRDLARRRIPVQIRLRSGDPVHGSIDRAAADHLDLAVHEAGEHRRTRSVREFRMIPFSAIVWARMENGTADLL